MSVGDGQGGEDFSSWGDELMDLEEGSEHVVEGSGRREEGEESMSLEVLEGSVTSAEWGEESVRWGGGADKDGIDVSSPLAASV